MLHDLVRAMLKVAPALDLWPVAPMISVSPAAKSYHFGASFPHGSTRSARMTDRTGRLAPGTASTWSTPRCSRRSRQPPSP